MPGLDLSKFSSGALGRKEMFYLTTHSTHFIIRLYGVGYIIKDHSDSERKNHMGYSFQLAARVLLYAPSHRQDTMTFIPPVVEHWLVWEIAQWVHYEESIRTISERSYHRATSRSWCTRRPGGQTTRYLSWSSNIWTAHSTTRWGRPMQSGRQSLVIVLKHNQGRRWLDTGRDQGYQMLSTNKSYWRRNLQEK